MKDNEIEITSLSDYLRMIELQVRKSDARESIKDALISQLQHTAKQAFDLGMNGKTYIEVGE